MLAKREGLKREIKRDFSRFCSIWTTTFLEQLVAANYRYFVSRHRRATPLSSNQRQEKRTCEICIMSDLTGSSILQSLQRRESSTRRNGLLPPVLDRE